MYVEDLFAGIHSRLFYGLPSNDSFDGLLDEWHRNFIASVNKQITNGKPLSSKQSQAILRLIAKVRHPLVRLGMATGNDIDEMLHHPQFRRPLYESVDIRREVRYLGDNKLGFRFKQHETIVARLRELCRDGISDWRNLRFLVERHLPAPVFNVDCRLWVVPVMHHTLAAIMAVINEFYFDIDDATMAYLRAARQCRNQPSSVSVAEDVLLVKVRDDAILAGWITEVAEGLTL